MKKLLEGRVAVVTGAGRGIGKAEAIGLANQGAKVVVNGRIGSLGKSGLATAEEVVEQIRKSGGTAVPAYGNVEVPDEAENIINTAMDNFGRIDILINNAGTMRAPCNVADVSKEDWEIVLRTHLFGTFYCTQHACFFMRKQGYGRIINTSSHIGFGFRGNSVYGTAKEGVVGFTRSVARDMAEFGVTCNAIRPRAVEEAVKNMPPPKGMPPMPPRLLASSPEDVASLVVYLATEQADHINGCIFEVWHGHVGIFTEPPPIIEVIEKEDAWTIEELIETMPQTLTKGRSRQSFPPIMKL